MPRDFLIGLAVTFLIPLAEKWIWARAGLPPMRWWHRTVLFAMTVSAFTLLYGWRYGFEDIWQSRGDILPALGGLLFVAALFAAVFVPYQSRDDSISKVTPHP